MSHYSNYQASQYLKLFNKYATHESGKLSLRDLYLLMVQFGMEMAIGHLKELVYVYDSHRCGMLDFEDFLLFLGDYEACKNEERERIEKAFVHFQKKTHAHGVTCSDLKYILQLGDSALTPEQIHEALQDYMGDSRPEIILKTNDFISKNFGSGLAWCDHQPHAGTKDTIVREIVIRNLATNLLRPFARTKLRKGRDIEYFTLDPFIVVECAGVSQETTILIGEVHPSWQQELTLQVKFPATTDFFELQRWIEGQRVTFHLYDYMLSGTRPHKEWIATGYLPLATVLASSGNAITASFSLVLHTPILLPEGTAIKLDVSAVVNTDRLTPYFELPEEIWVSKYHPKMRQDLQFGIRPNDDAERFRENSLIAGNLSHVFWDYYFEFYQQLKGKFRRRNFQLVGLNEYNQFWCLSSFVRPLYATSSMCTPEMLANNVARIDSQQGIPHTGFHPHTTQVASPALVLFRKYGSPLEHAILLCDLFLGIGLNAFVCIGTIQSERSAWVVTLDNVLNVYHTLNAASAPSGSDSLEQPTSTTDGSANVGTALFRTLSRSRSTKTANRTANPSSSAPDSSSSVATGGGAPSSLARSNSGNRSTPLRRMSEIIISPPASDDESDDGGYDEAIAFAKQNLTRKIESNSVNLTVVQDVFSLIENLSKKKYTAKKKVKTVVIDSASTKNQKNADKKDKMKSAAVTMLKKVMTDGKESMQQVLYSSGGAPGGHFGLTSSALQFDDSKFPPRPLVATKVSFWDATTGKCCSVANQTELPPINVGCLFNNRNVWVNIQKYDLVSRLKWDLDRIHDWFPFLDDEIKEACGPVQCWYSEPTQLSEIVQEDPDATPNFVQDICTGLQQYRSDTLGISESPFFSPICKILQEATSRCESQLNKNRSRDLDDQQGASLVHNPATEVVAWVESEVLAVLPDHHSWVGKPYHFHHAGVDEIMQQLAWTGILDCTLPRACYSVGAQIFDYPWGLKSVWVYVGYCADLFYGTQD